MFVKIEITLPFEMAMPSFVEARTCMEELSQLVLLAKKLRNCKEVNESEVCGRLVLPGSSSISTGMQRYWHIQRSTVVHDSTWNASNLCQVKKKGTRAVYRVRISTEALLLPIVHNWYTVTDTQGGRRVAIEMTYPSDMKLKIMALLATLDR